AESAESLSLEADGSLDMLEEAPKEAESAESLSLEADGSLDMFEEAPKEAESAESLSLEADASLDMLDEVPVDAEGLAVLEAEANESLDILDESSKELNGMREGALEADSELEESEVSFNDGDGSGDVEKGIDSSYEIDSSEDRSDKQEALNVNDLLGDVSSDGGIAIEKSGIDTADDRLADDGRESQDSGELDDMLLADDVVDDNDLSEIENGSAVRARNKDNIEKDTDLSDDLIDDCSSMVGSDKDFDDLVPVEGGKSEDHETENDTTVISREKMKSRVSERKKGKDKLPEIVEVPEDKLSEDLSVVDFEKDAIPDINPSKESADVFGHDNEGVVFDNVKIDINDRRSDDLLEDLSPSLGGEILQKPQSQDSKTLEDKNEGLIEEKDDVFGEETFEDFKDKEPQKVKSVRIDESIDDLTSETQGSDPISVKKVGVINYGLVKLSMSFERGKSLDVFKETLSQIVSGGALISMIGKQVNLIASWNTDLDQDQMKGGKGKGIDAAMDSISQILGSDSKNDWSQIKNFKQYPFKKWDIDDKIMGSYPFKAKTGDGILFLLFDKEDFESQGIKASITNFLMKLTEKL
ncbi:MAG: hypothetical protein HQK54_02075, partial [Oligoflexales bacterium]|nr:hypothetical protein [Oligoflexales bacterium]